MPISRYAATWIKRPLEDEFRAHLQKQQPLIWPIIGPGGAGKSSLLHKFLEYCKEHAIPALMLDPTKELSDQAATILTNLPSVAAPHFKRAQEKLSETYRSAAEIAEEYGPHAADAWALLTQAQEDQNLGLVLNTVKGAVKLAHQTLKSEETRALKQLVAAPEEHLWQAFRKDVEKEGQGVILIDTYEQSISKQWRTRLFFHDNGEIATPQGKVEERIEIFRDYIGGIAHFILDLPVLMVFSGRPPKVDEIGNIPLNSILSVSEPVPFNTEEIAQFLRRYLPAGFPAPDTKVVESIRAVTHGNPFLLERVAALVKLEREEDASWDWSRWDWTLHHFSADERYGLLQYVTKRLATHIKPDDEDYWRLAAPRQLHRDMADILFPPQESRPLFGVRLLEAYEKAGIVYRLAAYNDQYFLHDETRSALVAFAKHREVWRNEVAAELHQALAEYYDHQTGWQDSSFIPPQLDELELEDESEDGEDEDEIDDIELTNGIESDKVSGDDGENDDDDLGNTLGTNLAEARIPAKVQPALIEAAYHDVMSYIPARQNQNEVDTEKFWEMMAGSLSLSRAEKRAIAAQLLRFSQFQIDEMFRLFDEEVSGFEKIFGNQVVRRLRELGQMGRLSVGWDSDPDILRTLVNEFPDHALLLQSFGACSAVPIEEREMTLRQAIAAAPDHADHLGNFANFLTNVKGEHVEAEEMYRRAIAAAPDHANNLGNFAVFLKNVKGEHGEAEEMYRRAIAADPEHANHLGNFANFLTDVKGEHVEAEEMYRRAIAAAPDHANNLGNFANFLTDVKGEHVEAEEMYRRAIAADPDNARHLGNFANFLTDVKGEHGEAEEMYRRAIAADPDNARHLGNFANFLTDVKGEHGEAEEMYRRAIAADPDNARHLGNFANFLTDVKGEHVEAEEMYRRAIAAAPDNARHLGNFAVFLKDVKGEHVEAEEMYRRAIAAAPDDARHLGNFANFLWKVKGEHVEAEEMYRRAIAATPENARHLGNFAVFLTDVKGEHVEAEEMYRRAIAAAPEDARHLGNFAVFLTDVKGEHAEAEEMYRRAIAAAPDNAWGLERLALFLFTVKHNYAEAESLHRRAIELEPNDPNHHGNFARMLLAQGQMEEGKKLLNDSFSKLAESGEQNLSLQVELCFYDYAHFHDQQPLALGELKKVLLAGGRSLGWELGANIERAEADGHPNIQLLRAIAEVISKDAGVEGLDTFDEWRAAE